MIIRLILFFCFIIQIIFCQEKACPEIDNKEAKKNYEQGIDRKKNNKEERVKYLKKALELEPEYAEANYAFAKEIIATQKLAGGSYKKAEPYLKKCVEQCPRIHSEPYYYLGAIYYESEEYDSSYKYTKKFLDFLDDDETKFAKDYENQLSEAKQISKYAKFYSDVYKKPVPFNPVSVPGISTVKDEYLPIISPNNELALFTRREYVNVKDQIPGMSTDKQIEVFCFSERKDNFFDSGKPMPEPFNKNSNEGGATVSIDNKHLFYTICKDEGGPQPNCDIYYSDYVNGKWTEIKNLGSVVNDPKSWDSQPTLAADGKTLYFVSNRNAGIGGIDIYKTVRDNTTGEWGIPVNLGPKINSSGNEKSPFMHSDSETMYFSSNGHIGIGGYDIFYARKNEKGEWEDPVNIGYPINTESDDLGFFVSTDGNFGYFASNSSGKTKGKTMGGWDIYSFELYKEARPQAIALLRGELKDQSNNTIKGASVEITNASTKEKVDVVTDTSTGEYAAVVSLKKKEDYIITVKKEGLAFNSQLFTSKDSSFSKPVEVSFKMEKIQASKSYQLNNIYYETSSAELKKESIIVIEEFVDFLKLNPSLKVEIRGYTDNVGDEKNNVALSTDRAFTVYDLILQKGISKSQLIGFKGFGANYPVASNTTEQGRSKNRRTEFFVIE